MSFLYDDGGRAAAGFRGKAGDCVTRAIAIAMRQPYREIYDAMAALNDDYYGRKLAWQTKYPTAGSRRDRAHVRAHAGRTARKGIVTETVAFHDFMEGRAARPRA
jgi:hypothetical protein